MTDTTTTPAPAEMAPAPVATPDPTATPAPVATPTTPAPENRVPQSALDRVTAEKWEERRAREAAERKAAALEATVEELRRVATGEDEGATTPPTAPAATTPPTARPDSGKRLTADELQKLVTQQAEANAFRDKCNASVEEGRKAHTDFDAVVLRDLRNLSPVFDPVAQSPMLPQALVEAALETGEAHEVLYALGKDPSRAERLLRLPPIRQAVEVAKFASELASARTTSPEGEGGEGGETTPAAATPPNVSRAPAPVRSAASRGAATTRPAFDLLDPSKSTTSEWIAKREAELAAKRANGARRR